MEEKLLKVIEKFKKETKKDCYKISLIDEIPSIMDDKIGGLPYLPVGISYPKDKDGNNLPLLLQVNLKNIDLKGYPKKGILEIFTDESYPCQYVIKYFADDLEYQKELPDIDISNYIVDRPYKINLTKDVSYMSMNDYRFKKTFIPMVNEEFRTELKDYIDLDNYLGIDWADKLQENCKKIPITFGGYADFTQKDPRNFMIENKDECLFKLDSWESDNKIYIRDSGILFVLISQEDIEKCKFANAIVDWDCY